MGAVPKKTAALRLAEAVGAGAVVLSAGVLAAGCGGAQHAGSAPVASPVVRTASIAAHSSCARPAGRLGYEWPIQPFDVAHPVRGNFGDPRTISPERFGGDASGDPGDYSFHNGIDISAEPGTRVFAVVSGIARVPDGDEVIVKVPLGARSFQYRHIRPRVRSGQRVMAYKTVLGVVKYPARHVHLSEIDRGRVVNPARHIRPYADRTAPTVRDVMFESAAGGALCSRSLAGLVDLVAEADDGPPQGVPGAWAEMPVAPALVRWRLLDAHGTTVAARTAADFRTSEPPTRGFWRVYAAGTYQNFPVFDHRFYWRQAGRFLFDLTPDPLDTTQLADGTYTLEVAAADICGNRGTLRATVTIANGSLEEALPPTHLPLLPVPGVAR
jgi:hypothetical protein